MKAVLTDFDGTVTKDDISEMILNRFAGEQWLEIEARYRNNEIGTREAVASQFGLVRADRQTLIEFVDSVAEMDEHFHAFQDFCLSSGVYLEIVSEGLDLYLTHLVRKWGIRIPFRTNKTCVRGGRITLTYPFEDKSCRLCGTCKMGRVLELRAKGYKVAYVGDGHSDICPALEADLICARDSLAELCEREEIAFIRFSNFSEVQQAVEGWL